MNTNGDRSAENGPDLSSLPSPTHTGSMSQEEPSLRDINDTRLIQALTYLNDEGGDDSPARYMKRVFRIHNDLVRQLAYESNDFDHTLHQHLRAVVRKELNAYHEAIYDDSPILLEGSDAVSDSEHFSEDHPTSAAPALYRTEEGPHNTVAKHNGDGGSSESDKNPEDLSAVSSSPSKGGIDYKNLTLGDIRSRLQLPKLPEEVEDEIKKWCTGKHIVGAIEEFQRYFKEQKADDIHTFRDYLVKLGLEEGDDPIDIRHAVNTSPTKLRASTVRTSSQSTTRTIHATREQVLEIALDTSTGSQANPGKLPSSATAPSPVARKIDRSRTISLKNSPRRQSGVSTAPTSAETTPTDAAVLQHGSDDIHESNTLVKNTSQSVNTSVDVAVSQPSSSKKARRKRSIGEQAYTPEKKRKRSATPSSLKKPGGARRQTPERSVTFMSEDSDNMTSDSLIAIRGNTRKRVANKRTPKPVRKASPKTEINLAEASENVESKASPSKPTAASRKSLLVKNNLAKSATKARKTPSITGVKGTKKASKAVVAGKAVHDAFEEKVVERSTAQASSETRSTRSGAKLRK